MKIAVYGSAAGDIDGRVRELAKETGRQIALKGHTLITGGCPGLPYEAVIGASDCDGEIIGFSPGVNLGDHMERFGFPTERFSHLVYIPGDYAYRNNRRVCLKLRNVSSVAESDAAVIISGRCGTLNEFTIAYDLGKIIGVLIGTSGMTKVISDLVAEWRKPSEAQVIYEPNPGLLIDSIEARG